MKEEMRKGSQEKKGHQPGPKELRTLLVRLPEPRQKNPLLSRPSGLGWEAGIIGVLQPGQIECSVVVNIIYGQ